MRANDKLRIMMTTEGTYPFHQGGVSTWCNVLVDRVPNVEFTVYSVIMNPQVTQKFTLPGSARLIKVPLWGTEDPSEHLEIPFSQIYLTKKRTDSNIVHSRFLPLFYDLIQEILVWDKDPIRFAHILHDMYCFFKDYDYKNSFKTEMIWDAFKELILSCAANPQYRLPWPTVFDLIQSLGWIYRFFTILNTPVPEVDVSHSAAAAFCSIPNVIAKFEYGTPFLLTEHGVYLREQYLSVNRMKYSSYLKTFLVRLVHSITNLSYSVADQVSPVCNYNTRWEKFLGVSKEKIEVIYNGVDNKIFAPGSPSQSNKHLTVVTVARIDPVKDLLTLLRAAALVKNKLPDIRFIVYGTVAVQSYYEECLELCRQLKMDGEFIFAGHTNDVPGVLRSGDVVALSSISEAFPYSVVEAMMAGKAVVATDVGGVREAIADCGLVVTPGQPEEFARALITLLENQELRENMGEEAHKRALNLFTLERSVNLYTRSYRRLALTRDTTRVAFLQRRQNLLADRGYALAELHFWEESINQFQQAIELLPDSAAVPVLLTEIAAAYYELNDIARAENNLLKARLLMGDVQTRSA